MLANALPLLTTGELRLVLTPRSASPSPPGEPFAGDDGAPNRLAAFPMLIAFVRRAPLDAAAADTSAWLSFAPSSCSCAAGCSSSSCTSHGNGDDEVDDTILAVLLYESCLAASRAAQSIGVVKVNDGQPKNVKPVSSISRPSRTYIYTAHDMLSLIGPLAGARYNRSPVNLSSISC